MSCITEQFELAGESGAIRGVVTKSDTQPRGCVICLHGSPNGDLHGNENVFDQISDSIVPEGFTTIQFSFNGSLPSEGQPEGTCLRTQCSDYNAIIAYAQERFSQPLHVIGESAGATIASLRWRPEVSSYVLLWPAFDLRNSDLRPYLSEDWQEIARRDGLIRDNGIVLGAELIQELLSTDFSSSFQLPNKPVLIAHGQVDREVPYEQSLVAISRASAPLIFHSHPQAGHGFKQPEHRKDIVDLVQFWFKLR